MGNNTICHEVICLRERNYQLNKQLEKIIGKFDNLETEQQNLLNNYEKLKREKMI